jgi:purine-binding chemotaxis protein CheW
VAADGETNATQYLTFTVADEYYGVSILRVQEIRGWEPATRVPNAPEHVKGVINLRSSIVPVYDLRQRFGLAARPYTKETVVVVLRCDGEQRERHVGVVVDTVVDVLIADASQIASTAEFAASLPTEGIRGLVCDGARTVMLVDVDWLVAE